MAEGGPIGILLECDGVLIDAHREGHRVAFNRAFTVRAAHTPACTAAVPLARGVRGPCVTAGFPVMLVCPDKTSVAPMMQDLEFQCMHMNPSVFHDLLRSGDGSPEGLLGAFFDAVSATGLQDITQCDSQRCAAV